MGQVLGLRALHVLEGVLVDDEAHIVTFGVAVEIDGIILAADGLSVGVEQGAALVLEEVAQHRVVVVGGARSSDGEELEKDVRRIGRACHAPS